MKKFKSFLSMILCVAMLLSTLPMSVFAVSSTTETSFEGYIPISTKEDLNNIRDNLSGKYYLTNNIVFSELDFSEGGNYYNDGAGWSPIGTYDEPFVGTLDGNGYAIKNLKISINSSSTVMAGMFGFIEGNIVNLGMDNCSLSVRVGSDSDHSSNVYVGGFVARSDSYDSGFQIDSCYFSGNISVVFERGSTYDHNKLYVGGIIGQDYAEFEIKNCINYGNIEVQAIDCNSNDVYLGGILGYGGSSLVECSNRGSLSAYAESDSYYGNAYTYAGGISGKFHGEAISCYNLGTIISSSKTTTDSYIGTAEAYAGGIAADGGKIISDCYNSGKVEAIVTSESSGYSDEGYAYAGGIVGTSETGSRQIINSFNNGQIKSLAEVNSSNGDGYAIVGGIIGDDGFAGWNYDTSNPTVIKCCNYGELSSIVKKISYNTGYAEALAGGIAGTNSNCPIKCCYNSGNISAYASCPDWEPRTYTGGIVGSQGYGEIIDCFNSGNISSSANNSESVISYTGGISGLGDAEIINCYNVGTVQAYGSNGCNIGGITGGSDYISEYNPITNCYYLNTLNNGVGIGIDLSIPCSIVQLQNQETFSGFDFDTIWKMGDSRYPYPVLIDVPYNSNQSVNPTPN